MALTFAEEVLRALQDALSFYEALLSCYAKTASYLCVSEESDMACAYSSVDVVPRTTGGSGVVDGRAMDHEMRVASHVLDR